MTDDERELREQVEEDRQEDLELDDDTLTAVRGGQATGNTKWGDIELKRGIDSNKK